MYNLVSYKSEIGITMGKLVIIGTPIGNLEDITLRALRNLREANIILAEDTRTTQKLLSHYEIYNKTLFSFFEGNEDKKTPEILARLQHSKELIALVSESGMPLISDPGYKLVREAIYLGIPVEIIPGPTALTAALSISGLPPNAFVFLGFLPKKEGQAKRILEGLKEGYGHLEQLKTGMFYESPHRVLRNLNLLKDTFGDVNVVVTRELTKLHEEVIRGKASDVIIHFENKKPKGEFVVLFQLL